MLADINSMPRTRVYRHGILETEGFPVAKVSDYLADPSAVVWFDLCEPTDQDLVAVSQELGLHRLAVEDAILPHERPKLDRYKQHLFLTAYSLVLDPAPASLPPVRSRLRDQQRRRHRTQDRGLRHQ